jgi:hypothetical protein
MKLVPALALAAIVASCGGNKKADPVTVSKYVEHRDTKYKFALRYPENWATSAESGRAAFYSSQIIANAFAEFKPEGNQGAKVEIGSAEGGPEKITSMVAELRDVLTDPNNMKAPENVQLNGLPATKVSYGFGLDDGSTFTAERWYVASNGVVTYIETAVIGDYAAYKTIFDSVRASFVPGQMQVVAAPPDSAGATTATPAPAPRDSIVTDPPSSTLKTHSGSKFSIGYPENFSAVPSGTGASFVGARNDSKVDIKVTPAEGMSIDDVQKAYAKSLKSAGSSTSVGGQKGVVFSMSPNANVSRRIYVTVANDTRYQITMDMFKPQANLYQPVYDKMIASFKAK